MSATYGRELRGAMAGAATRNGLPETEGYTWRGYVASPGEIVARLHELIAAGQADGFVPYVYGASTGAPSRGRPDLVLTGGLAPETTAQRFERELGESVSAPVGRLGMPRRQGCGTAAGAQQHYRAKEKPCEPCRLAANAARRAVVAAQRSREEAPAPPAIPVPEAPSVPAERCRRCGYLATAPGHLIACGSAR